MYTQRIICTCVYLYYTSNFLHAFTIRLQFSYTHIFSPNRKLSIHNHITNPPLQFPQNRRDLQQTNAGAGAPDEADRRGGDQSHPARGRRRRRRGSVSTHSLTYTYLPIRNGIFRSAVPCSRRVEQRQRFLFLALCETRTRREQGLVPVSKRFCIRRRRAIEKCVKRCSCIGCRYLRCIFLFG